MSEATDKAYPSMAATGLVEVELPSVPGGPWPTEKLHARDIPALIISRVERALEPRFKYLHEAAGEVVLGHYVGALQGADLVDKPTSRALDKLVADFSHLDAREQPKYFEEKIAPFIAGLRPKGKTP